MADQGFGKFKSIDEFLESYKAAQEVEQSEAEKELPFDERVQLRRQQTRNIVVISATLRQQEPDGAGQSQHIRLLITVTELLEGNPAVNDDVERVLQSGDDVFLAVRIGDAMGITKPIEGLVDGVGLKTQGEWIPRDRATAHGGRSMSVLHFTHHPVGFICVEEPAACYS